MKNRFQNVLRQITRIQHKKIYLAAILVFVFVLAGSAFSSSSAKDKTAMQVDALKVKVQDKTNEIQVKNDTIIFLNTQISQLKQNKQEVETELYSYQQKEYELETLNGQVKDLQAKYKKVIETNKKLKKKVAKQRALIAASKSSTNTTGTKKKAANTSTKKSTSSTKSDKKEEMVHITDSGSKYHKAGCSCLRDSDYEIPLSEAEWLGYTPCKRCH